MYCIMLLLSMVAVLRTALYPTTCVFSRWAIFFSMQMCIRDSSSPFLCKSPVDRIHPGLHLTQGMTGNILGKIFKNMLHIYPCLLYTSPRKPMVRRANKSAASRIFEVAWRSKEKRASVSDIPVPSSITWMQVLPASVISTCISSASASIAFSTNSFTTRCV